jgi:hypothetical protein
MLSIPEANQNFSEKFYERRLIALTTLSIANRFISSMTDIHTRVTEKFASKKSWRMDLNFHH